MAEKELLMEEGEPKKGKMMIIIIVAVVLIAGGAAAFFFMGGDEPQPVPEEISELEDTPAEGGPQVSSATGVGTALYVAMPRPFVFNVPGTGRDRLVQIKVQLMVRGADNEDLAKMHIPMIEGTLLRVFSQSNADDLVTEAGKIAMKDMATKEVQKAMQEISGGAVVEQILFTGFVMQ